MGERWECLWSSTTALSGTTLFSSCRRYKSLRYSVMFGFGFYFLHFQHSISLNHTTPEQNTSCEVRVGSSTSRPKFLLDIWSAVNSYFFDRSSNLAHTRMNIVFSSKTHSPAETKSGTNWILRLSFLLLFVSFRYLYKHMWAYSKYKAVIFSIHFIWSATSDRYSRHYVGSP